ncbi:hypothetical protein OHV05_34845 [Kitasatospora sp. NBC_00070]|uniref:hypothetical protein n=1 Tax=Kitasatospora sp. NBC_00070 TaxID=2975962 RepID=UPI00324D0D44
MTLVEYAVWKGIDWEPTQAEASAADLVLIADALGSTVEQLLAGDFPGATA